MQKMKLSYLVCPLAVALTSVPGGAQAQSGSPPQTDQVAASFGLAQVTTTQGLICQGADGTYFEVNQVFAGPITSSDVRLSGTLTTNTFILVNETTGLGSAHGTFDIRDSFGNLKVTASFNGAISAGGRFKGFAVGSVSRLMGGGSLSAAISIVFSGDTSVGDMGSPAATVVSDLGVIQKGSCSGHF